MDLLTVAATAVVAVAAYYTNRAIASLIEEKKTRNIIVRGEQGKEVRIELPKGMSTAEIDALIKKKLGDLAKEHRPRAAGSV